MNRYIFVADEMGTPGMAPGTSNSFVFGGYVVLERHVSQAVEIWRQIKSEFCGTANVELKWKHFFVDADDPKISCPIKVKNRSDRRHLAALGLDYLFHDALLVPVVAVSRKDRATDALITQSRKGKDKLDDDLMWLGPVAQFATFLSARRAKGKLCFDGLGSEKQEKRRQESWSVQLQLIRNGEYPPEAFENLKKLSAIEEEIEFLDSSSNEAVQIADLVCGVIWKAAEGDEAFLSRLLDKYGPNASRQGLGIMHLQ